MAYDTRLVGYLAQGAAASRPAAPNAATNTLSFYFATDTETLSIYDWNDAAWQNIGTDAQAQDAVGAILADTNTINATYTANTSLKFDLLHKGAMVRLSGNIAGSAAADAEISWDTSIYSTTWQPNDAGSPQRFWLGADFTFATTDVNTGTSEITETGHGFTTGEGPVQFSTTTTLPAGIVAATNYWIIRVDNDLFKIATNRANAIAGTNVSITTQGTGTHTCVKGRWFVVPAGVSYVEFGGWVVTSNDLAGALFAGTWKNGAVHDGGDIPCDADATFRRVRPQSGVIAVSEGDRLSIFNNGADAFTILGGATASWASIKVHQ